MINRVFLDGYVGNVTTRVIDTVNGPVKVANFTIATNDSKDSNGNKIPTWHRVQAWKGTADIVDKFVKKGSRVFVEGSLRYGEYTKEGTKISYAEILASSVTNLSFNQDNNYENGYNSKNNVDPDSINCMPDQDQKNNSDEYNNYKQNDYNSIDKNDDFEDDLPF